MAHSIYIATLYSRRFEAQGLAATLEGDGHHVTSNWVYGGEVGLSREQIAEKDLLDLAAADTCVSLTSPLGSATVGGGRHVEFGYALASDKRCIVLGERENVFHHYPGVEQYDTEEELLQALCR